MFKKNARRTGAGIMSLALLLGTVGYLPTTKAAAASGVIINEVCPKNTSYAAPDGGIIYIDKTLTVFIYFYFKLISRQAYYTFYICNIFTEKSC